MVWEHAKILVTDGSDYYHLCTPVTQSNSKDKCFALFDCSSKWRGGGGGVIRTVVWWYYGDSWVVSDCLGLWTIATQEFKRYKCVAHCCLMWVTNLCNLIPKNKNMTRQRVLKSKEIILSLGKCWKVALTQIRNTWVGRNNIINLRVLCVFTLS